MTDQQKNTSSDDDYQFPQDEYAPGSEEHDVHQDESQPVGESSGADKSTRAAIAAKWARQIGSLPMIKNKRIIVAIVAVIILIIIFRFFSSPKAPTVVAQPPATQQSVVQPVASSLPAQLQPISTNTNNGDMMGSLDTLNAHTNHADSQIKSMQAQMADMQNTIDQAQSTNQQLQKSVTDLTVQMKNLSDQLTKVLAEKRPSAKPVKLMVFHLRAVLPDRAWITSTSGETITVTIGDPIQDYGTVQAIDVQHGIIETSSGRKIEYGSNDY